MRRPGPPELLAGVCTQLEDTVLPELEAGAAARQLKAALHLLRRLERSWDRMPAYLRADNDDLRETLGRLAGMLGEPEPAIAPGSDAEVNDGLQALLARTGERVRAGAGLDPALRGSALAILDELYRRMIDREAWAWGTT